MKLALAALLVQGTAPSLALASPSDDCKTEAIEAGRAAFGEHFHVVKSGSLRRAVVHATPVEALDYTYSVEVNKGTDLSGTWTVVLDQQCNATHVEMQDEGRVHAQ